ncbi:MAG: lipopolysaccharide biosynthesis protein [Phycisphaerae bacterium]
MASLRVRTVVLALGQFVHTGLTLVLAMVLSRLLQKEVYGTFREVLFIYMLLAGVLGSNIAESLLYFLPRSGAAEKRRWLGQTVQLSLVVGVVLGAIIYTTADVWADHYTTPELASLLKVFAWFPLADRVVRLVPPALIAEDRALGAAVFTVVLAVAKLGSAIVPCMLGLSLAHVFWSMNACWLVLAAVGVVVLGVRIGVAVHVPALANVKAQARYIWPLLAASIVGLLQELFGHHVVLSSLSASDYADYANGAFQLPIVGIWTSSIAAAIMPDLVRLGDGGERTAMLTLWHRAFRKGALVIFPVTVLALTVADQIITCFFGPAYVRSTLPFALYLLVLPARAANYGVMFRAVGRNRAILIAAVFGLAANAVVTLTCVYWGRGTELVFVGPAIGYVAGAYAAVAVMVILLRGLVDIPLGRVIPFRDLAPLAALALAAGFAGAATRLLPAAAWVAAASSMSLDNLQPVHVSIAAALRCVLATLGFGIVFIGLGTALRVFDASERSLLRRAVFFIRRT